MPLKDPVARATYHAAYSKANRERTREYKRKYAASHPERVAASNAAWASRNPNAVKEKLARYEKKNADRRKMLRKANRLKNRDKILKQRRDWYAANLERERSRISDYGIKHRDGRVVRQANRKARIRAIGGVLSSGIVQHLMTAQGGKCACCGVDITEHFHLDHIMPIVLGGRNEDSNVQLLSPTCNVRKGAKHPDEWRAGA